MMAWLLMLGTLCQWPAADDGNSIPWSFEKNNQVQGAHWVSGAFGHPFDFTGLAKYKHCMMSGCFDGDEWYKYNEHVWNEWCEANAATSLVLRSGFCNNEFDELQMFNSPGCSVGTDGLLAGHLRCCDGMNLFQCNSGNIYGGAATTIQSSMDFSFCPLRIGRATTGCDGVNLFQCNAGNVNQWDSLQRIIFRDKPWCFDQCNSGHIDSNNYFQSNSGNFDKMSLGTQCTTFYGRFVQGTFQSIGFTGARGYCRPQLAEVRQRVVADFGFDGNCNMVSDDGATEIQYNIFSNVSAGEIFDNGELVAVLGTGIFEMICRLSASGWYWMNMVLNSGDVYWVASDHGGLYNYSSCVSGLACMEEHEPLELERWYAAEIGEKEVQKELNQGSTTADGCGAAMWSAQCTSHGR